MFKKVISLCLAVILMMGIFIVPSYADVGDNEFTEIESNNSLSLADRIYNDYTVSGMISSKNDIDFYKFVLTSTSKVELMCIASRSVIMVGITDSSGEVIAAASPSYRDGYYYDIYNGTLSAGTYYIVLLEDTDYSYTNLTYLFYFAYESASHYHSYSSQVVSPTCTAQGYTLYTCSCGYSYTGNYKNPVGHSYASWFTVTTPTCTEDGLEKRCCNYCSNYETRSISANGHTVSDWIVDKEATCTEAGSKHKECTVCKTTIDSQVITVSHIFSDWIVDKEATCTETGSKHKECTVCKTVSETEVIDATGHIESDWIVDKAATCTESGLKHKECTICKTKLENQTIPKTHAISSEWIVDVAATCTEKGSKHKECTECGVTVTTKEIEATGHSESAWITGKEPTCTVDGWKYKECTACGETLNRTTVSSLGHLASSWIIDREATCSQVGSKHKECAVCNEVLETANIAKVGHTTSDWIVDKDSTCTENGSKHTECIDCGETIETEEISAAHKESSWITDTKATVNKAGSKHKECTECGVTLRTVEIKQLKCSTPKLSKVTNTAKGIKFTWKKTAGADSYVVYRKTGSGSWEKIADGVKTTSYTDKTAKKGVNYKYTVKAKNEAGYSAYNTNGISIKRLTTPTLKSVSSAKSGVTFKWNKVTGATGYIIMRKTGNGSWKEIATVKGNARVTYLDKTAKKGTTYKYTVKAYYGASESAYNTNGLKIKDRY